MMVKPRERVLRPTEKKLFATVPMSETLRLASRLLRMRRLNFFYLLKARMVLAPATISPSWWRIGERVVFYSR